MNPEKLASLSQHQQVLIKLQADLITALEQQLSNTQPDASESLTRLRTNVVVAQQRVRGILGK